MRSLTLKNHLLTALALISLCAASACSRHASADSEKRKLTAELYTLDRLVKEADSYDSRRRTSIDSIKHRLVSLKRSDGIARWRIYQRLGDEYISFSSDSAVVYYTKAITQAQLLHDDSLTILSHIGRINALAAAGIFAAAQYELDMIDTIAMPRDIDIEHAKAGRQLYSYMASYVEGHEELSPNVALKLKHYSDFLLENMDPTDRFRQFLGYETLVSNGNYSEVGQKLEIMLKSLPKESNLYGRAAYQLAQVYLHNGNEDAYARTLALAAESDILGSVKEGIALPELASWLYNSGDTRRAYDYINLSMRDAKSGNARMRTGMIASAITVIDTAYQDKIKSSRLWIFIMLILAIVSLAVAVFQLRVLAKRKKRIADAQVKLRDFTRVQDSYIGHFIGLCASYSDKLNSMSKLVNRKISSGQADDLLKMVKSGKFAGEQSEDFFRHFDKVFLDLYPDFVFEINKLLRDDSKIMLKEDGNLTAELRIYAFVRLGVDESIKISKILHYSPATIYTYRNKMRNRAINRDSFDADVMRICSHK